MKKHCATCSCVEEPRYRYLAPDEEIQNGDEFMGDKNKSVTYSPSNWQRASRGNLAGRYETLVFRRRIN